MTSVFKRYRIIHHAAGLVKEKAKRGDGTRENSAFTLFHSGMSRFFYGVF
jgi:hypothetical protein